MRFEWSDEQIQLQDMVRRMVAERYDFDSRKRRIRDGDGRAMWAGLAELGLLGLPFAEADGGFGGNMLDVALVMEAFGRGLVVEPYLPTVVLAGGILRRVEQVHGRRQELISRIISGDLRMAVAVSEGNSRYNADWCETAATPHNGAWQIDGAKSMVPGGDEADIFIVPARVAGDIDDSDGLELFLIPRGAAGLHIRPIRNIDGTGAAELTLSGVNVAKEDRLELSGAASAILRAALEEANVAACAEAVGAMSALNVKTLAYARERKAFGQEVAQFQVVQHRLVDMRVGEEQACAITLKAAQALALGRPDRSSTVAAAKYLVNEEGRSIARHAVQLHGAIGITDELDISHYFRRLFVLSIQYGDSSHALRRYISAKAEREQG